MSGTPEDMETAHLSRRVVTIEGGDRERVLAAFREAVRCEGLERSDIIVVPDKGFGGHSLFVGVDHAFPGADRSVVMNYDRRPTAERILVVGPPALNHTNEQHRHARQRAIREKNAASKATRTAMEST